MSKYYNRVTATSDGAVHASKREAIRWAQLKLLEKAGHIKDLRRQVKYVLIPPQYEDIEEMGKNGKTKRVKRLIERECSYIADFVYVENGRIVIEDAKGYRNPSSAGYAKFMIKRKLMLYVFGHKVREV